MAGKPKQSAFPGAGPFRWIAGSPAILAGLLIVAGSTVAALAHPARIIILRHAEKLDHLQLCAIGTERSVALATDYLGKGALQSLFAAGAAPGGFYSVTLHTLETLAPSAGSWGMPQSVYAVVPDPGQSRGERDIALNRVTQQAAKAILTSPALDGMAVVMAWENHHIADPKMEARYPGEAITLRQLLHLDRLAGVPARWPKSNFDYVWIADYADPASSTPTGFRMEMQRFGGQNARLPMNAWGAPANLQATGCLEDDEEP